jgi:hypothetical protein
MNQIEISYNGQSFFLDIAEGKMVNLNRIFAISGASKGKEPKEWVKLDSTKNLIKSINGGKSPVLKTKRGVGGGTWAHWQLALSYAQYLSTDLHVVVNQVFKERLEEAIDPELGITRSRDRAVEKWRREGKDEAHIQARLKSIEVRNEHTSVLKHHGVTGYGFGNCTNNIYQPILGGKASDIRKQRGLSSNANLRDNMTSVELVGIMFAETLASDKINRENRQGNNSCASACLGAGMNVKSIIDKHESSLERPKKPEIPTRTAIGDRIASMRASLQN